MYALVSSSSSLFSEHLKKRSKQKQVAGFVSIVSQLSKEDRMLPILLHICAQQVLKTNFLGGFELFVAEQSFDLGICNKQQCTHAT